MTAQRSPVGGDRARASVLDREQLRRRYLAERDERLVQGMRDPLVAPTRNRRQRIIRSLGEPLSRAGSTTRTSTC
jgi:hypothetical protein